MGYRMHNARAVRRGFGYAIDYDKEIALDEVALAAATAPLAQAIAASLTSEELSWMSQGYLRTRGVWLFYKPETFEVRAALLGLDAYDVAAFARFAMFQDLVREEWVEALAATIIEGPLARDEEWRRCIAARRHAAPRWASLGLDERVDTAEELEKARKHAQTALARHKRNKAKHGGAL